MNPNTFGGSPAAEQLVAALERLGESKLSRKVCKFIELTDKGLLKLDELEDDVWFCRFVTVWRNSRLLEIDGGLFPAEITSFMRSLTIGAARKWIRRSKVT